jgi:hypothetical protein
VTRNEAAARMVAFHVECPDARAEILEMLALVNPDGSIRPDDTRSISMEQLNTTGGGPQMRQTEPHMEDRPKVPTTAPDTLRHLAPVEQPPKPQRRTKTVAEGRPSRAKADRKPRKVAECGTPGGYNRHLRVTKDETCQPCRDAHAAKRRAKTAARAAEGLT